jgi:LuxR family maltose regulon positive regulatory protein
MKMVVLQTKVNPPPVQTQLVPRPRLLTILNAALGTNTGPGRKLTLISAPAGFGKSTLLGQWLASLAEQPAPQIVWLSLDSGENDLARFFTYLVAAVQVQTPNIGAGTLALIQSPLPPTELILSTFINEVATRRQKDANGGQSLVLILDDYHLITAPAVHEAMVFLLEHLPHYWHVVLSSRHDPPFPVARLRAQAQLTELRQTDLRFTTDEADVFLKEIMHLPLSSSDAGQLATRTEGWVSGLQIAALALQSTLDVKRDGIEPNLAGLEKSPVFVSTFVKTFRGSHRYILDYLLEEVLRHQSQFVQQFLMQTSILERLSAPLCDAVIEWPADQAITIRPDSAAQQYDYRSQEMLEFLEANNLFVVPLDNERGWYRYHHLFADLLRLRLQQIEPDLVPRLHQRASSWYETAGFSNEAITHALAAGDNQRAVALVAEATEPAMMRGEVMTVRNWIEVLPAGTLQRHPRLALFQAWALFMTGGPVDTVNKLLDSVDKREELVPWTAPVRAYLLYFQGDMQRANHFAQRALQQLPEDEYQLRNLANLIRGVTAQAAGDIIPAAEAFKAIETDPAGENRDLMMATLASCMQAEMAARRGDLHQAWELFQQVLAMNTETTGGFRPIASEPLFGLSKIAWQRNQLEQAMALVEEGIQLAQQWSKFAPIDGYLLKARLLWTQGNYSDAEHLLAEAAHLAVLFDASELDDRAVSLYQTELAIKKGDWRSAEAWASVNVPVNDLRRIEADLANDPIRKYEYLTLAELQLARGKTEQALALLDLLYKWIDRYAGRIRIRLLQSLAHEHLDQGDEALEMLSAALSMAEPAGFKRVFLEYGEPAAQLLYKALAQNIAPDFVGSLLAAFGEESAIAPKPSPADHLVEPLSARELEVLSFVAQGLTNQEIADRLFLSLATIKWHTGNIYSKLGVSNRTEAVTYATQLGLFAN